MFYSKAIHVKKLGLLCCKIRFRKMSSCMKQNDPQSVAKLLMNCNYIEVSSVNCISGIWCLFMNTDEGSAKLHVQVRWLLLIKNTSWCCILLIWNMIMNCICNSFVINDIVTLDCSKKARTTLSQTWTINSPKGKHIHRCSREIYTVYYAYVPDC